MSSRASTIDRTSDPSVTKAVESIGSFEALVQHKKGLFRKKVTIHNMLSWTKVCVGVCSYITVCGVCVGVGVCVEVCVGVCVWCVCVWVWRCVWGVCVCVGVCGGVCMGVCGGVCVVCGCVCRYGCV